MKKVYNKLVRDKMIDIYKRDVENKISASNYSVHYLGKEEILKKLKEKLLEEVNEVLEVYDNKDKGLLKEEVADVIEALSGILYQNGIELSEVLALREIKKQKKGGFEEGLFLEWIDYFDEKK